MNKIYKYRKNVRKNSEQMYEKVKNFMIKIIGKISRDCKYSIPFKNGWLVLDLV